MLFRTTDIVLFAVMVSAAAFTYKTKHDAEAHYVTVKSLERQIQLEQDAISLLKADWSLLTQPARLQRLAEAFQTELKLQPIDPRQFADIADVPAKQLDIDDILSRDPHDMAAAPKTDKLKTGAIKP